MFSLTGYICISPWYTGYIYIYAYIEQKNSINRISLQNAAFMANKYEANSVLRFNIDREVLDMREAPTIRRFFKRNQVW